MKAGERMRREAEAAIKFTLIELLVVISIIAILTSLLLPGLAKSRMFARTIGCVSQERQILVGVFSYADSYNGWGPGFGNSNQFILDSSLVSGSASILHSNLLPFISGNSKIFQCPADSGDERFWHCAAYLGVNYGTSYGHSILRPSGEAGGTWSTTFAWSPFRFPLNNQLSASAAEKPSKTAFIGDAGWTYTTVDWAKCQYHSLGYNVGFLDGHAATYKAELQGNAWNQGYYRTNW